MRPSLLPLEPPLELSPTLKLSLALRKRWRDTETLMYVSFNLSRKFRIFSADFLFSLTDIFS